MGISGPMGAVPTGGVWGDPNDKASYTLEVTGGSTSTTTYTIFDRSFTVQKTTFTCQSPGNNCKLGPNGHFVGKP
jgi:hypothetical protein